MKISNNRFYKIADSMHDDL